MFSNKDAKIIAHLRNNARKKITNISEELNIPVTTIYDKVRVHEKRYIKKHTTLLDFSKLGLHSRANLAIKVGRNAEQKLQEFLMEHPNVNSLSRINFGHNFMAEVVFKDVAQLHNFKEKLEDDYKAESQVFNIIEELKKEDFLTKPEHENILR